MESAALLARAIDADQDGRRGLSAGDRLQRRMKRRARNACERLDQGVCDWDDLPLRRARTLYLADFHARTRTAARLHGLRDQAREKGKEGEKNAVHLAGDIGSSASEVHPLRSWMPRYSPRLLGKDEP